MSRANLYTRSIGKVPGSVMNPIHPTLSKRRSRRMLLKQGYGLQEIEAAWRQINQENRTKQRRPE